MVLFSPDGKWLLTTASPCRLWEVGTWREVRRIGDVAGCFSPDGRLLVVQQGNKLIRLVETETGRTLARLESPDLCPVVPTFSPDGSRLVVSTNDGPAVHVWDLRAIRKQLAGMGLDWDAPAYSADDPTDPSAPPLTSVQVRYQGDGIAEGAALAREGRWDEAASAYARAFNEGVLDQAERWLEQAILRLAVGDAAGYRQSCQRMVDRFNILKRFQPAGLEDPAYVNNWHGYTAHTLALAPGEPRQAAQALQLATRWAQATHPASSEQVLGLALYRAGRFAEADTRLRSFLDRDPRRDDHVLDWLVLSMANQRLGRSEDARLWLERAEALGRGPVDRAAGRSRSSRPRKLDVERRDPHAPLAPRSTRLIWRESDDVARKRLRARVLIVAPISLAILAEFLSRKPPRAQSFTSCAGRALTIDVPEIHHVELP